MASFQITLTPKRRAATRFIVGVRRSLQRAFADQRTEDGLTQSDLARRLDVHRSVITKELRGQKDISLGRVAELSWALGREPHFELRMPVTTPSQNNFSPSIEFDKPAAAKTDIDLNAHLTMEMA